jgi:hypothetical protein
MATSGKLRVHIIAAKLTRDTETFGKMDPYVIISTRMQRVRTKTAMNQGKTPQWINEFMDIDVKYIGDDMLLQVFDEDVTDSDHIGENNIKLSSLCVNGGIDEWFEIQHKGKKSGSVHLKSEWNPSGQPLMQINPNDRFAPPPVMFTNGTPAMHNTTKAPTPTFYVITTPVMAAPAMAMGGYGAQPMGMAYAQPQMGYPQQQQYGQPPMGYAQPPMGYPQQQYG